MVRDGVLQQLVVEIIRLINKPLWFQQFRTNPGPGQLFSGHAVVVHESHSRKGCGSQNTHPTDGFRAHIGLQQKVQPYGNQHCRQREAALPHGEAKEHGFTVGLDLFIDFYFQWFPPFCVKEKRLPVWKALNCG